MDISLFGLGYVGMVSSLLFADRGNKVIGVEINKGKRDLINNGKSPIAEPGIDELLQKHINRNFFVTNDYIKSIKDTNISIIAVGTPSKGDGSINLSYVEKVIDEIGEGIKHKNDYHLIIIRSTVLPGTTEKMKKRLLNNGIDENLFDIVFHPEFLREGSAIKDFLSPPFTIVGTKNVEKIKSIFEELYKGIDAPMYFTDIKVAETIKYASNAFHALKVSFANEIGRYCKEKGIDAVKVMEIFTQDRQLNISPAYLRPGFAFGGSCLPKDVKALLNDALKEGVDIPLLESVLISNEKHIEYAYSVIEEKIGNCKKIGFIGVSFKVNTDDLRESPIIELMRMVYPDYSIKVYDPIVQHSYITGSNKVFIDKNAPFLRDNMVDNIDDLNDVSIVVVYSYITEEVLKWLNNLSDNVWILDLYGIKDKSIREKEKYRGIVW